MRQLNRQAPSSSAKHKGQNVEPASQTPSRVGRHACCRDRDVVGESSEVEGQLVVRRQMHILDLCGHEAQDRREALHVARVKPDSESS